MTVLVTGGSGFIGSHLVERLLSQGEQVRCLVRNLDKPGWLKSISSTAESSALDLVVGDCTRPDTLQRAVAGVERVYHVAGATWALNSTAFFRHNAQATRYLLDACQQYAPDLGRFVYVSSLAAAGPGLSAAVSESDSPRPLGPYGASKAAGEYHVLRAAHRLPTVILRPAAVYGPRDEGFLQYFRLVKRGFLVEFGPVRRRVSMCHVADVVTALVVVGNSQVGSGSIYFVADPEPYCWSEVESILTRALGVNARRLRLPRWILRTAGTISQHYSKLTGKAVNFSAARAVELVEPNWVCDVIKLQHELGLNPSTSLEQGLREAVRWYQKQKWL